jgi:hypothetical protein
MDYKNRFEKVDALKETENLLNITPDEADRKLRNVNSQYLRETTSMCSEIRKLCHLGTRYAQCNVPHLINNLLNEAE